MKRIIFGLLLVTAGVLLLCFNYGIIPIIYRPVIFSWPMILIALGLMHVFTRENIFSGIVFLLIGAFFLLPRLFFLPENFAHDFWPGLLIIIGIFVILKRSFHHHYYQHHMHRHNFHSNSELKNDAGFIVLNNVFGGGKYKIPPTEFKGGQISNVFGGTELDLTQATLAPGTNVLEVDCVFGGISIIVPSDWVVRVEVSSVLGGFNDKRNSIRNADTASDRELIIKGSAIFGGGDVKNCC
jgi:predicted membrane protein